MPADDFSEYTWNLRDIGILIKMEYPSNWECVESYGKEEDYRELVYSLQLSPDTPYITIKVSVYPKTRFKTLEDMGKWYIDGVVKFPEGKVITEEEYQFQNLNGKRYVVQYSVQYPVYRLDARKFRIREECIIFRGNDYFCRIVYMSPAAQFKKYYPAFRHFRDRFNIVH